MGYFAAEIISGEKIVVLRCGTWFRKVKAGSFIAQVV